MDKEIKFSLSQNFTKKSLSFLLILSVFATVLGFATAYNEHRNLTQLWTKYDEALEKIQSCEEAVSELSQQIAMQEFQYNELTETTAATTEEDFEPEFSEEYFYEENYPSGIISSDVTTTTTKPQTTVAASSAVSSVKYFVTKSGSKYHIGTCSFLSKSKIAITMDQIKAEGYTPCSRCIK